MKVFVIGNCQHQGLAACLRAMLPAATVRSVDIAHFGAAPGHSEAELLVAAAAADLVIAQPLKAERFGLLQTDRLSQLLPRFFVVPIIAFDAYHPDCVYIDAGGRHLGSPMGGYHSQIVAAAFLNHIPAAEVPRLFNALTYARLGYFDRMAGAEAYILARGRESGMDLRAAWQAWQADGPFMYTVNHPAIRVLHTLASLVVEQAGLNARATRPEDMHDALARTYRWPVYPEIARRLPCESGDLVFDALLDGDATRLSLPDLVAGCYPIYERNRDWLYADARVMTAAGVVAGRNVRPPVGGDAPDVPSLILALYQGLHQRPDPASLNFWTDFFAQHGTLLGISAFVEAFSTTAGPGLFDARSQPVHGSA